jgi:hypothetical protein
LAESHCRARPRRAADDRPAPRLRPRLTQEFHHRHHQPPASRLLNSNCRAKVS